MGGWNYYSAWMMCALSASVLCIISWICKTSKEATELRHAGIMFLSLMNPAWWWMSAVIGLQLCVIALYFIQCHWSRCPMWSSCGRANPCVVIHSTKLQMKHYLKCFPFNLCKLTICKNHRSINSTLRY